jgi:Cu-processing system permease protein
MNIILLLNPLIAAVFGALYYYNSREFTELLLALPLRRSSIFTGKYLGLAMSLALSFVMGCGIPFLVFGIYLTEQVQEFLVLLFTGTMLTLIFSALAFLVSVRFDNPIKGFGASLFLWLLLTLIYDGVLLLLLMLLEDYPVDRFALAMSLLNPVDLSRILIMIQLDISALMGYTGAVFIKFFGTWRGMAISAFVLILWAALPVLLFLQQVSRKDF